MSVATSNNCISCYLSSFLGTISSTGLSPQSPTPPISITLKRQFSFITKLNDAESLQVSEQAVKRIPPWPPTYGNKYKGRAGRFYIHGHKDSSGPPPLLKEECSLNTLQHFQILISAK